MNKRIGYSLLDINQSLKKKCEDIKRKNEIVYRIWTKEIGKLSFQSERSTLNFFNNKRLKNMCPYCNSIFGNKNTVHKNKRSWTFICPACKSTLKILNE